MPTEPKAEPLKMHVTPLTAFEHQLIITIDRLRQEKEQWERRFNDVARVQANLRQENEALFEDLDTLKKTLTEVVAENEALRQRAEKAEYERDYWRQSAKELCGGKP